MPASWSRSLRPRRTRTGCAISPGGLPRRVRAVIESMNGARFVARHAQPPGSPAVRSNARARITRARVDVGGVRPPHPRHRNRAWLSRDAASTAPPDRACLTGGGAGLDLRRASTPYHVSSSCHSASVVVPAGRCAMRPDRLRSESRIVREPAPVVTPASCSSSPHLGAASRPPHDHVAGDSER